MSLFIPGATKSIPARAIAIRILAGMAVKMVAAKLSLPESTTANEIEDLIEREPDKAVLVKQADEDFKLKIREMEIIEELENLNRSFYAGCMGYFDSNGDMDTCISLRSGLVKNGKLFIQAGGGVVYDSNPEDEYQETINKAGALMAAAQDSYKYNT